MAGVLAATAALGVPAQPADPNPRGRLLYENHCVACHSQQMHWREQRLAADWTSLLAQVRAWQARQRLGWSDDDIFAVAGHLNDTIYHHPREPTRRVAAAAR